jgi:hypothetical protein
LAIACSSLMRVCPCMCAFTESARCFVCMCAVCACRSALASPLPPRCSLRLPWTARHGGQSVTAVAEQLRAGTRLQAVHCGRSLILERCQAHRARHNADWHRVGHPRSLQLTRFPAACCLALFSCGALTPRPSSCGAASARRSSCRSEMRSQPTWPACCTRCWAR